jgi:hypothetical protein
MSSIPLRIKSYLRQQCLPSIPEQCFTQDAFPLSILLSWLPWHPAFKPPLHVGRLRADYRLWLVRPEWPQAEATDLT